MGGIRLCGSFPVPRTTAFPNRRTRFFRPISNRTYSAEIPDTSFDNRNLRHQRIIKQLPHIPGQDVRSRATDIILQFGAHYKEI